MAAHGDPYGPLVEKLQLPHPLIQRFAVNAIFGRFKSGPSHAGLESPAGQEALARCLTSTEAAVIDQTVKEICQACAEGAVPVDRGLLELQAALDAVNSESVASVMNGIGYLCRIFLQSVEEGAAFLGKSGDLLGVGFHPLVKSFQSRTEEREQILRQVGILVMQASPRQQRITLDFLQPFIAFVLLQPLTSPGHALFARDLHSQLSLLSCRSHSPGLMEMLVNYVQLYSTETTQGREFVMASIKELVDVWESLLKQSGKRMEVKGLEDLGSQLLCSIVFFSHELLSCKVSMYHALVVVKRVMNSLSLLSSAPLDSVGVNMVSMAHMLAMVDLEQEQRLLLDLGFDWVEYVRAKATKSGNVTTSAMLLVWVFPALQVMSYPSVTIKAAATRLLRSLESAVGVILRHKNQVGAREVGFIRGEHHLAVAVCRLLQMRLEGETAVNWVSGLEAGSITHTTSEEQWLRSLTANMNRCSRGARTLDPASHSLGLSRGLLVSLCTLVTVFLLHPNVKVAVAAAEALASIGRVESIWGMSLLQVGLFCVRFQGRLEGQAASEVQLGLLKVFPSLACHSATLSLVVQALQPMLDSKSDVVVQATAIRLLCKTWEFTDRAFPHLQKVLKPEGMRDNPGLTELHRSRAACIRDVSKKDPDRGIDLVLSVQACIESKDPVVLSLGLQSLAFLCKEDVIDFYTAWLVISNHFAILPPEPVVLQSLCLLLRYGALDAAAHPEAAAGVLEILWKAATREEHMQGEGLYSGARAVAFESLSLYKVDDLELLCPDEKSREVELLFSETSVVVLASLEGLVTAALAHEHSERQRGRKEVKVPDSKLWKQLKAFPGALNATGFAPTSGKIVTSISDFTGAALLCFSLPAPEKTERVSKAEFQKVVKAWQTNYEKIFLEAADQLHFGHNLVIAILSLQSWCSFISRWLHAIFTICEAESPNIGRQENLLRAAQSLSKIIQKSCEVGIPRVAENATLALAALCKVMPAQAHGISAEISRYLELRLLQEGHEHMQWSATFALGWVSTCLHATDWSRKYDIVQLLLKHPGRSDRGIVRGACGLALGIVCQSLLTQESISDSAGQSRQRETELLLQIVLSLIQLTSESCPMAAPALRKISGLLRTELLAKERLATYPLPQERAKLEEENLWAVVGLVWGLGSSVTALQQLQHPALLSALTELMISWISIVPQAGNEEDASTEGRRLRRNSRYFLAAGACLVLSTCVEVSGRLEILTDGANVILQKILSLIVFAIDLNSSAKKEHWWSALLSALYIGAGNLLATLLQDGAQSIKLDLSQSLLEAMQTGAESTDQGSWGQLGAMIGIANSLGAGAALLGPTKRGQQLPDLHMLSRMQVGSSGQPVISRPLLHEAACEEYVSVIVKKLLGVVRTEQNSRLRSYAGWALAFTHNGFFGGGELEVKQDNYANEELSSSQAKPLPRQSGYHMKALQDFPPESTMRLLCTKFISQGQMNSMKEAMLPQTVASVFRCLKKVPRLPAMDWDGLTRRLLRQNLPSSKCLEDMNNVETPPVRDCTLTAGQKDARQQCVLFAIAHAEQVPALASFLDDLSELSRIGTLEASLRNLLACHVFQLQRIFSPSRLKQLLRDVQDFIVNPSGLAEFLLEDKKDVQAERQSFRVSLWNGLAAFFKDSNFGQGEGEDEVISCVEECMTVLINLLPGLIWTDNASQAKAADKSCQAAEEWSAAVATLAKAQKTWLLQAFEVQISDVPETKEKIESISKVVFGRCQLVLTGCFPVTELKVCRRWLMNHRSFDMLQLLVEVAWAMKEAPLEDKKEWLLDSLDIAFISPFPTTAVLLVALLASSWSAMAPMLPLNPICAIQDLPLTIPSLLSQTRWGSTGDSVAYKFTLLLDRLGSSSNLENQGWEILQVLDSQMSLSELFSVLRRTCIGLKRYLPLEVKLNLAKSISSRVSELLLT